MRSIIVIPARYKSSRFPGKPLTLIAGKTMLERVAEIAKNAAKMLTDFDVDVLIATDDDRIFKHAKDINVNVAMTSESCPTGSDRILEAVKSLSYKPEIIVNLQGDAPLIPPSLVASLIKTLASSDADVATPAIQLTWDELEKLRDLKKENQFNGTTVTIASNDEAIWFSKNIIPAIRKENILREKDALSPVFKHFGLYGYKFKSLDTFASLPKGYYEQLEELEQLRFLENGYKIKVIKCNNAANKGLASCIGVDTAENAKLVEQIILAKNENKNEKNVCSLCKTGSNKNKDEKALV